MNNRQPSGVETAKRLLDWQSGPTASQRFAYSLLSQEGYSIDPAHPLGGPDGGKDATASKDGKVYVVAIYFPIGQQSYSTIFKKAKDDFSKVKSNTISGIIFFTNQRLSESEKQKIKHINSINVDIYHLERVATLLDMPINYGRRLEFLDIAMEKEEQLAFYAAMIESQANRLEKIQADVDNTLLEMKSITTSVADHSTGGLSWILVAINSLPEYNKFFDISITTFGDHIIPVCGVNISYQGQHIAHLSQENLIPNTSQSFSAKPKSIIDTSLKSMTIQIEIIAPCFNTRYSIKIDNTAGNQNNINNIFTSFNYKMHHSRTVRDVIFNISQSHTTKLPEVSIVKDEIHKNVIRLTLQKAESPEK